MKVRCAHGYFFFTEEKTGELARFTSLYGFEVVPKDWYYTFKALELAPNYSLKDLAWLDATAVETFAGTPWDVMRKNKLVFDFTDGVVKPITDVRVPLQLSESQFYFFSSGLILPGSINSRGMRVTDFSGQFPADGLSFRYTEVRYDQNT